MSRVSTLFRSERKGGHDRCVNTARQTGEESAALKARASGVAVPEISAEEECEEAPTGTDTDVWAEESLRESDAREMFGFPHFGELGFELGDGFAVQERQTETSKREELGNTLKDFLDCIKQVKGTVTEDMQAMSRELARHSVGATSAKSFAELQHHLNEIVQLSGPELGCAWSTVKVGLGVASVFSGNLLVGSFMVALAAGSLGTSIIWKAHRDSQRNPAALTKTAEVAEIDLENAGEGAGARRCVSRILTNENGGSRRLCQSVLPFSRQFKARRDSLQVAPHGKEGGDDSMRSGAPQQRLTEYDAWSGEG